LFLKITAFRDIPPFSSADEQKLYSNNVPPSSGLKSKYLGKM